MKLFIIVILLIRYISCWKLHSTYNSTNFFDHFHFFSKKDPTGGVALYQNATSAVSKGLIRTNKKTVLIKADNTTVSSYGRDSIRLFSKESYNHGLFVIDLNHMPTGCGCWPAFWLVGNSWSKNGEIDIIEGVNTVKHNTISIHSNNKCIISSTTKLASGLSASSLTCSGTKCSTRITHPHAFGADFNQNNGGIYVVQWIKATSFHIWFFPRDSIPADITSGMLTTPALRYEYGSCNPAAFSNLTITLDLAFCGSWAGNSASYRQCPMSCETFVKGTPDAFSEAYWDINYIKVYQ
ncbi:glycoside hydrolase family 16 protein [Backusella circina FSU 941]|nr:glycoside hydrolase family 16 protein [Backusella circina FSU 941]